MRKMLMVMAALVAATPLASRAGEAPAPLAVRFTEVDKRYEVLGPVGPYYPQPAIEALATGSAVIDCAVGPGGSLRRCKVVQESPRGVFFGAAAKRMAQTKWIIADPAGGVAEGVHARFLVPFEFAKPKSR